MKSFTFCILGGDMRQVYMANSLARCGNNVKAAFFDNSVEFSSLVLRANDLQTAIAGCDVVVLPLPYSNDGIKLNTPLWKDPIYIEGVLSCITKNQLITGGKLDSSIIEKTKDKGIEIVDYLHREEFAILNAIPTAEGAIQIAMEETPITLHSAHCLIVGFGRIGKVLMKDLHGLGAKVCSTARKHEDLAWIKAYGYEGMLVSRLQWEISRFDIIFNTAPGLVLDETVLKQLKKDCLVIDLASKPGGVDFETAQKLGIRTIWSLSLPGKVAPVTAGEIVKDTILNIASDYFKEGV